MLESLPLICFNNIVQVNGRHIKSFSENKIVRIFSTSVQIHFIFSAQKMVIGFGNNY